MFGLIVIKTLAYIISPCKSGLCLTDDHFPDPKRRAKRDATRWEMSTNQNPPVFLAVFFAMEKTQCFPAGSLARNSQFDLPGAARLKPEMALAGEWLWNPMYYLSL